MAKARRRGLVTVFSFGLGLCWFSFVLILFDEGFSVQSSMEQMPLRVPISDL